MRGTAAKILVPVIVAVLYVFLIRPRLLRWGATDAELARVWPGDDLAPDPDFSATRAITVEAPPDRIWPWLVQIGQGRGGLYSYDWLENLFRLNIHSVDRIVPELQQLKPGDIIAFAPDNATGMVVVDIVPQRALILRPLDPKTGRAIDPAGPWDGAWSFILEPQNETTTRLVVRSRARYERSPAGVIYAILLGYLLEPVQFVMERRMLLGIRERAVGGAM